MYLIRNHHTPIINPEVYNQVQVACARRIRLKPVSEKTVSKKSRFNSKYALTGLVVCANCGGKYRRTTWQETARRKTACMSA